MPYIITETLAGNVKSISKVPSWRQACAVAAMRCEDRLRDLESILGRHADTSTMQHARREIRHMLAYVTGSDRGYRLPKPILPSVRSVTDANPWKLTIERT